MGYAVFVCILPYIIIVSIANTEAIIIVEVPTNYLSERATRRINMYILLDKNVQ